jgi:hypothetical protein
MQRALASEAEMSVLPAPRSTAQQPLVPRDLPANTPVQQILNLQRAIGNRAVQRLLLSRKPDDQPTDAKSPAAVADKGAVSNPPAKADAPTDTVATNWFLDSWGVAGDRKAGRAGRRDSNPEDVIIVDGLTIGSDQNTKTFEMAGNALPSGRSRLGPFAHSKGPGDADGVVSYATQRDIVVDFKANTPPETGPMDKAAKAQKLADEKAVKASTEKMVLDLIRRKDSEVSGDWSEVEKQAVAAAAQQLPAGSNPTVKIDSKVKHDKFRLQTTPYQVEKPAACTVKIDVPTATTTYQVSGGESDTTKVSLGVGGSASESQKLDIGGEIKTFFQNTRSSFVQTVNSMHHKIVTNGPGTVESDKGSDLSLSERAKKWLKDKASSLWETAKDKLIGKAKSFLENKLAQWIIKGLELDSYIEIKLTEWVVDWLGDKAADKIKGWFVKTKSNPTQKPCDNGTTFQGPSQPDPRKGQCHGTDCHERHAPQNMPPAPQPTGPVTMRPGPMSEPCPPVSEPPLIKSDDSDIVNIFSESTNEIISSAAHADLEVTKDESQGAYIGVESTHHTEHHYSGPVTKETIGHPAIEVIVEDR